MNSNRINVYQSFKGAFGPTIFQPSHASNRQLISGGILWWDKQINICTDFTLPVNKPGNQFLSTISGLLDFDMPLPAVSMQFA